MANAGPRRAASPGAPRAGSTDTRAALIDGAIEALREVGFAGASAREIARRAGCNQALVFYHFGSVTELLLAALDDISTRRLEAYQQMLDEAGTLTDLIDSARTIFSDDLDSGHVAVLVEMISGAQAIPGLGEQVAERLAPWRAFAETAVRKGIAGSPVAAVVPVKDLAHAVVAGFLGLELLAGLDGDRAAALALFDRARMVAALLDLTGVPGATRQVVPAQEMTVDVVTGAFSYSGAAIARELQAAGRRVRTLTGHPERAPAGSEIDVRPLAFDDRAELTRSLHGRPHALQHVLGAFRARPDRPRRRSREQPDPVRGGNARRRRANRARLDHQSFVGFAVSVLSRQGRGRTDPRRGRCRRTQSPGRRSCSAATEC